jgi:TRAP-type C4-dicarboxylate transport system substrate-binding protein
MKQRTVLALLVPTLALSLTTAAATADERVFRFRVATIEGTGTPMNDAFVEYIERLKECSGGRLQGRNFPDAQLGGFIDLIDGNRRGIYEMTMGGFDVEGPAAPELSALSLGWVFQDYAHVERVIDEMLEEMSQRLDAATGVTVVAMGDEGWRTLFSSRPVRNLEELRGLKIRVPQAEIPLGMWRAVGASPTPVPFTEIYSALQTGVIDGGEGGISQIDQWRFYEPAPHITQTHHWYNIKPVRVNSAWLRSLPQDLQACVRDEGQKVFAAARQRVREDMAARLEKWRAMEGVEVYDTPADIDEWATRAAQYEREYFAKYPAAEDFINRVRALAN